MWKTLSFLNLPKCVLLSNGIVELAVATEIGPRILKYGFVNGPNILGEYPELKTETSWGTWRPWGGHRLWVGPEAMPQSYAPDNSPIDVEQAAQFTMNLSQKIDQSGTQKEMTIRMESDSSGIEITHRVTNRTESSIKLCPWAITIMREGGVAVIPLAPFRTHDEELLPAQPIVRWFFTDWTDPRWGFGRSHVALRGDNSRKSPQKIGTMNREGWCGFLHGGTFFIKSFPSLLSESYPDLGCNNEVYGDGSYIELESLGPLTDLEPGRTCSHVERWRLVSMPDDHGHSPLVDDALYRVLEYEVSKIITPFGSSS